MKKIVFVFFLLVIACKSKQMVLIDNSTVTPIWESPSESIKIAFGSCNRHDKKNVFWDDILALEPDIWIWGGDNVYADTDDFEKLQRIYQAQNSVPEYAELKKFIPITGVWDDHDYGLNDGGEEFKAKVKNQQAFLDFMDIPKNDALRHQEGIYSSQVLTKSEWAVKIINLDTRYFRSPLKKSQVKGNRYEPDTTSTKTILGNTQWQWLENELKNSKADFNLIISSIQFLSNEHGFEKWSNFPKEVERMKLLLKESGARGIIFLSGDRHISEFSKTELKGLEYPLVDFTSSGLTHSYSSFSGEPNPLRIGKVVSTTSFGLVELNPRTREATFRIMGDNAKIVQELKQTY